MRVTEWIPENLRGVIFTKLADIAENLPYKEYKVLQAEMNIMRDYYGVMDGAKIEGREEGREEGRKEGNEEGRFGLFLNMLKKGATIETVKELTDISEDEIDKLKEYLRNNPLQ